jgi:hypothetical protein
MLNVEYHEYFPLSIEYSIIIPADLDFVSRRWWWFFPFAAAELNIFFRNAFWEDSRLRSAPVEQLVELSAQQRPYQIVLMLDA